MKYSNNLPTSQLLKSRDMPRPDVSDERIPQILDAATRVFSKHGIDGASMSQVAAEADISKATIYHYFASKDALVLALVQRLFDADHSELEQLTNDDGSAIDRLRTYSVDLVVLLEQNHLLTPIITEVRARADRMEAIQTVIHAYFTDYTRAFTVVIEQGIARGEVSESVKASEAALAYVALIEGAIIIAQYTDQALQRVMSTSVNVFLEGLR